MKSDSEALSRRDELMIKDWTLTVEERISEMKG